MTWGALPRNAAAVRAGRGNGVGSAAWVRRFDRVRPKRQSAEEQNHVSDFDVASTVFSLE